MSGWQNISTGLIKGGYKYQAIDCRAKNRRLVFTNRGVML